jgi:hypothetical protein
MYTSLIEAKLRSWDSLFTHHVLILKNSQLQLVFPSRRQMNQVAVLLFV